jgi:hypothetical protein
MSTEPEIQQEASTEPGYDHLLPIYLKIVPVTTEIPRKTGPPPPPKLGEDREDVLEAGLSAQKRRQQPPESVIEAGRFAKNSRPHRKQRRAVQQAETDEEENTKSKQGLGATQAHAQEGASIEKIDPSLLNKRVRALKEMRRGWVQEGDEGVIEEVNIPDDKPAHVKICFFRAGSKRCHLLDFKSLQFIEAIGDSD